MQLISYISTLYKLYFFHFRVMYLNNFRFYSFVFPVPLLFRCMMLESHSSETKNFGLKESSLSLMSKALPLVDELA